jgi:hypothetical protein
MNEVDGRDAVESLRKYKGPAAQLLGLLEFASTWTEERDYRGCTYLNMASEIPDPANPLRVESKNHYLGLRTLIGRLMKDLKAERGESWRGRDAEKLADEYLLIFAGAMALAPLYSRSASLPGCDSVSEASDRMILWASVWTDWSRIDPRPLR